MTEPLSREHKIYRVTILGGIVNALLVLFKFAAGIIGNSAAMVADAVHSLSDFVTDLVVLLFVRISSKPEDDDHDYGHGKYETIATSVIAIALFAVGVMLGVGGVRKIILVHDGGVLPQPELIALFAALLSIFAKEVLFRITRKVAREVNSSSVEANAWHHRSDALSSVATAVGIGGALAFGGKWTILDPIAALIVCVMIIRAAIELIFPALDELLEKSLPRETEDRICDIVASEPGVSDIHHLRTRKIGNRIAVEMHIRMPGNVSLEEAHSHASAIEKALRAEFGESTHIIIHLEPTKPYAS